MHRTTSGSVTLIKVGDKVRTIPAPGTNDLACDAVVITVIEHNPDNPIEDHGFIDVRFTTDKRPCEWSQEVECYTHHNWEKLLRIL